MRRLVVVTGLIAGLLLNAQPAFARPSADATSTHNRSLQAAPVGQGNVPRVDFSNARLKPVSQRASNLPPKARLLHPAAATAAVTVAVTFRPENPALLARLAAGASGRP